MANQRAAAGSLDTTRRFLTNQPSANDRSAEISATEAYDRSWPRLCKNSRTRFEFSDDRALDLGGLILTCIAWRSPSSAIVQFYGRMRPRAPAHEAKYEPTRPKALIARISSPIPKMRITRFRL